MAQVEQTIDCFALLERWDEVLHAVATKGTSFVVTRDGRPRGRLQPVDQATSREFDRRRRLLKLVRRRR
jgi:antitoxin (DNA-binding transcriptional repressor) of toxin-antitoxin stability system